MAGPAPVRRFETTQPRDRRCKVRSVRGPLRASSTASTAISAEPPTPAATMRPPKRRVISGRRSAFIGRSSNRYVGTDSSSATLDDATSFQMLSCPIGSVRISSISGQCQRYQL